MIPVTNVGLLESFAHEVGASALGAVRGVAAAIDPSPAWSIDVGGSQWALLDPWCLLLAPIAWICCAWRWRRPSAALPIASTVGLASLPRTLRVRLVALPLVLLALAITILAIALARPVTRDVVPLESEGVDILLVLDTSSSMNAQDMVARGAQRRIDAAREQALAFAKARTDDRVGMLTFARFADLRCPPTLDKDALAAFLRSVDTVQPRSDEDMTAIGVAVGQAVRVMRGIDSPSKVVVLLTDGQETSHEIDPDVSAKLAADAQIRVHTIGLGQAMMGAFGQTVEPDFGQIERIAETTGGRFFRARTAADLAGVYAEIDRMETRELEDPRYRTTDWFDVPLRIGLLLCLCGWLLELFWLRGLP